MAIARRRTGTRRTFFAMPSRAVDDAWHEFILFTREYHAFCRSVLGHYLHHSPAEAPSATASTEDGLLATWRAACALEGLSSEDPAHLPRLFAIDERLGLSDGVRYERRPKNPSEDARIPAGCPDGVVWIPTDGGGITGASAKRGRGSARCGGSFGGCGSGDVGGGSCGGGGCGGGG